MQYSDAKVRSMAVKYHTSTRYNKQQMHVASTLQLYIVYSHPPEQSHPPCPRQTPVANGLQAVTVHCVLFTPLR